MKIWYIVSSLSFFYCISLLVEERLKINYRTEDDEDQKEAKQVRYCRCFDILDLFENKTVIDLDQMRDDLKELITKSRELDIYANRKIYFSILDKIRTRRYFIIYNNICFHSFLLEKYTENPFSLLRMQKFYAFNEENKKLVRLQNSSSRIQKVTIFNKGKPYSDCINRPHGSSCLYDCVKQKNLLSKYYFDPFESGLIKIDYRNDKSIKKVEKKCIKKCSNPTKNCKLTYLVTSEFAEKTRSEVFRAYLVISNFNYFLQLVGLISLFLNVSLHRLCLEFVKLKVPKIKFIKWYLISLKIIILLIILAISLILSSHIILEYIHKRDYPIKNEFVIKAFESEFNLVACIPVSELLNEDNEESFSSKSFRQIEQMTDSKFEKSNLEFYLKHKTKKFKVDWFLRPNVYFRNVQRCFQIKVFSFLVQEHKSLVSFFKLIFINKYNNSEYYLLSKKENFNSRSHKININHSYYKEIIKRSRVNKLDRCLDYDTLNFKLKSRYEFIDECINYKGIAFRKWSKFSNLQTISKDHFSDEEWNRTYFRFDHKLNARYSKIKKDCKRNYSVEECTGVIFEESTMLKGLNKNSHMIELDIDYYIFGLTFEEPSWIKSVLDVLSVQIFLFGISGLKVLRIFNLLKFKLKLKFTIKVKFHRSWVYLLICSAGALVHLYIIYDELVNNGLVFNQKYRISSKLKMPEIIFCFKLKHTTDSESINKEFILNKMIKKIEFLNEFNDWDTLIMDTNFSNHRHLNADQFEYFNESCLILDHNINYFLKQFYFTERNDVLKIFFDREFLDQEVQHINFLTRMRNDFKYSKAVKLIFYNKNATDQKIVYMINIESYITLYNIKFQLISNPLSVFYKQESSNYAQKYLTEYADKLERNSDFRRPNTSEIDPELDKLVKKLVTSFKTPKKVDLVQTDTDLLVVYRLQQFYVDHSKNVADLSIALNFFSCMNTVTNEENIVKLILNLLNVFSFWLNFGILDFYICIDKINAVLKNVVKHLINRLA